MPTLRLVPASPEDYRRLAEKRLPRMLFDYVDGGAYQESTLAENVAAFTRMRLRQRVLRDVSKVDTGASVLGEALSMPLVLAPVGMAGMMARRGEIQAARAAERAGVPFCLSTVSICSVEEVAGATEKSFWFQLYMMKDRDCVADLLKRAAAAGCTTLVFTVDLARLGARYRDVRNGMIGGVTPLGKARLGWEFVSHLSWVTDVGLNGKPHTFGNLAAYVPGASNVSHFIEWVTKQLDASVTWKDIEWLRGVWKGKLIVKGVLSVEDALSAADAGADAVIVSNHGGRQLDGVAAAVDILPEIVAAAGGRLEILMDGGVRCGQDVVKAVALGARAVLIGRPWVWAVAARGEAGVRAMLKTFRSEMDVTMALTGATSVSDITRDSLSPAT